VAQQKSRGDIGNISAIPVKGEKSRWKTRKLRHQLGEQGFPQSPFSSPDAGRVIEGQVIRDGRSEVFWPEDAPPG